MSLSVFLTKLLTLGILSSIEINAEFVTKPLILGILFSISLILALYSVFLTSLLVSGILFSNSVLSVLYLVFETNLLVSILFTFSTNLSYTAFLTALLFLLHKLVYLNKQEQVLICQYLIYQFQFLN